MNVKVCRSKPEEFERSVDAPTDRSDAGGDVGVARDPQGSDRQVAEGRHHPWSVADPDLRGQPGRVGIPKRLAGGF